MARTLMLAALAVIAAAAPPATAAAAVAPGRVAFSVASVVPASHVDAAGATEAVALPDGGAAMLVSDGKRVVVVRVRSNGTPDPSFGEAGVARVDVPGAVFGPTQILHQPDGKLLAVGSGRAVLGVQRYVVARLTASGAPDPSFGAGGVASVGLGVGCANCAPAALAPDGSLVLTGSTGAISAPPMPNQPTTLRWAVQRLTPSGAVDPAFGEVVLAGTSGFGVVVRPSGRIVVLGGDGPATKLAGLTAAGAPDPSFNGGQPVTTPVHVFTIALRSDGGLYALDTIANSRTLLCYTPAGALDPSFGSGGTVVVGEMYAQRPALLPEADGGATLVLPRAYEATVPSYARMRVQRVAADGAISEPRDVTPAFGGGVANSSAGVEQNSFRAAAVARPNGSLLLVGGVSVVRYTGEGVGQSTALVAVAGLTAQLGPDLSVGGPQIPARARVVIPRQRARTALRRARVVARVTTSGPGLVQVRVRDGRGRLLAQTVEPSYVAGTATARVALTPLGRRALRQTPGLRLFVRYDFRDVLTARDRGGLTARLV